MSAYVQLDLEPVQGLHFLLTGEMKDEKFKTLGVSAGGWASVWWFFLPHCDLRIDGIFRNEDLGAGRSSVGMILGQLHLYL
jgi:hypothetical protein